MARKRARKKPNTRADEYREDGYVNSLTGVGDYLQDKAMGGNSSGLSFSVREINGQDCEDRWRGSDLGGRIVEAVPHEMTRAGWELEIQQDEEDDEGDGLEVETQDAFPNQQQPIAPEKPKVAPAIAEPDDESAEIKEALEGCLNELNAEEAVLDALNYERAYGGAAIMLGIQDGNRPEKPVDEKRIKSIDWMNVFEGGREGEILAWSYYLDPKSPNYGKPEIYQVRNNSVPLVSIPGMPAPKPQAPLFYVHESRLLVFPGMSVSRRARIDARGWGDSIFNRVDEVLGQFGQTWSGVASLMTDFSQAMIKTPGLSAALAGRNKAANANPITKRALAIQQSRSLVRMLFLDSEEEFARDTASLAGIADILQQFALRLSAAADMPVTLLMGQSPSGLSATGESDIRFFYDRIAARQKRQLLPPLRKLIRYLFLAKDGPTKGVEPSRWNIRFNPLRQLSDLEQAQLRKTVAETDHIYIQDQVLSPEEVTASAFGGSKWSMEREVDFEGRQEMAAQMEEKEAERTEVLSEAAKAGVAPDQLAMGHPERSAAEAAAKPDAK